MVLVHFSLVLGNTASSGNGGNEMHCSFYVFIALLQPHQNNNNSGMSP